MSVILKHMIPRNLKYDNSKESAFARSYTSHVRPNQSGPFTDGSTINLTIPCINNTVLAGTESVLKFDLTVTNGAAANAFVRLGQAGAHGIIRRLRLWHGSNLIEDLDEYSVLVSKLMALQQSGDASGKASIMAGVSNEYFSDVRKPVVVAGVAGDPTNAELASISTHDKTNKVTKIYAGERLWDDAAANEFADIAANGDTLARTYCINLLSIVGSLSQKYIPLFAMSNSGAGLRLELQLQNSPSKFLNSELALDSFSVSNVEYVAQMVELGDSAMQIIEGHSGEMIRFVVPRFSHYAYNATLIDGVETEVSIPIPARFSSLKSLFTIPRSKHAGAITYHASGSTHFGLTEYYLRLGSKTVPAKPPRSRTEFFIECLKAIGSVSDMNHEPNIDISAYDVSAPIANGEGETYIHSSASEPHFIIGADLESYSGASPEDIFQGYNSSTEDIFLNVKHTQNTGGNISVHYDTFAMHDAVIICQDGTMLVQY